MRNPFKKKQGEKEVVNVGPEERGNWGRQLEFTLSCVGYAVGLGNLWRFPYLCMRNGGGAFLIPYFMFLFLCGMPLFFLELTIGQFSSLSPLSVWKISPLFKGVGWGMIIVSGIVCIYYNIIIAWVLYFLGMSFQKEVPWKTCNNPWNTPQCSLRIAPNISNETWTTTEATPTTYMYDQTTVFNASMKRFSPAEEFWTNKILNLSEGIHDLGGIKWEMLVCLAAAWIIIYACLFKGIKSSGKVVYVTATVPYLFLTILLIRGLTLPGSMEGIKFYIIPKWSKLLEFKVWAEACLQIFYSLGPAWGGLITMASYNKFDNNHLKDSIVVCLACCGTSFYAGFVIFSVIGFMAVEARLPISEVITQGPGLAFVAYPEAIARLPVSPFWAICFFLMLLTLGLDSQFGMLETMTSGFVDEFPRYLRNHKTMFTGFVCVVEFLIGLPLVTRGGMYIFQIVDWYAAAFSVMVIALFECLVIMYIYGRARFYDDLTLMLRKRPSIAWAVLWMGVTPTLLLIILIYSCFRLTPPTYGDYVYPNWAIGFGWIIALCSIVPIPLTAIYRIAMEKEGTLMARVRKLIRAEDDWGPGTEPYKSQYADNKYGSSPIYRGGAGGGGGAKMLEPMESSQPFNNGLQVTVPSDPEKAALAMADV